MHRLSLLLALLALGLTASLADAHPRVQQPAPAIADNPADRLLSQPIEDSVHTVGFTKRGELRKHVDHTAAHQDPVHIGMSKAGAQARTSFWR